MPGVAQSKLRLFRVHDKQTEEPTVQFPSESLESLSWIDKQEKGFTRWLNFVLSPSDSTHNAECGPVDLFGSTKHPESMTVSKHYLKSHIVSHYRRGAFLLYRSLPFQTAVDKINREIALGRLSVKKDIQLHADVGIKEGIIQLLMSYNLVWLQVGLEVMYGERFDVFGRNNDSVIAKFLGDSVLYNSDIAKSFAHPTVSHSFRPGFEDAMNQYILKQVLYLVLFLDRAKLTRLIDHNPCLFRKSSTIKSSRGVLLSFSRQCLSGEGDIMKHLSHKQYNVNQQQTAMDEYDFYVCNLATDLRNGIVLVRLIETLTNDWLLSGQVKLPIVNRSQKLHNVELALKCLRENTVDIGDVIAEHIVDGYREKTLELLWSLILQFKVPVLLNDEQLRDEIRYLERQSATRCFPKGMMVSSDVSSDSPKLDLLLKWCQVVCQQYGLRVNNFMDSFADGRALCYIVHHYHPWLIPLNQIQSETTIAIHSTVTVEEDISLAGKGTAFSSQPRKATVN
jgi:abnormal spindle-like microcephaly-associated protein